MLRKTLLFLLISSILPAVSQSQERWTLQQCIEYAQENSLNVQQSELAVKQAELTEKANKAARYPNLNANIGGNVQFGQSLNPTTNNLESQTSFANSIGVSSGVILFNGHQIRNSIRQSGLDIRSAEADLEQQLNDIALDVAVAYLNILFAEEQLEAAKNRLSQAEAQLNQTDRLIEAGTLPQNDRLEILATIATNEQSIVAQENAVESSYLNLKQLMELDPSYELKIVKPEITIPAEAMPEAYALNEVYANALSSQPVIRAGDLRLQSAEMGIDIAKAGYYPRITAFGNLDTRYFSKSKTEDVSTWDLSDVRQVIGPALPVEINGEPALLAQTTTEGEPIIPNKKYFDQLNDFFGQVFGVNVAIPIYDNSQTRTAVERAKLNIISTKIQNQQVKQQLKSNVQRAIADARAAKKALEAAEKTRESLLAAYENTERRYQLGAVNTFQLTTAKNNLDTAEVDLIIAKYDYLYRLKIVEFYQGKELILGQ